MDRGNRVTSQARSGISTPWNLCSMPDVTAVVVQHRSLAEQVDLDDARRFGDHPGEEALRLLVDDGVELVLTARVAGIQAVEEQPVAAPLVEGEVRAQGAAQVPLSRAGTDHHPG